MKNSVRNLLWFFYAPSDEREVTVYQKAYHRAFSAAILLLGISLYVLSMFFSGPVDVPSLNPAWLHLPIVMVLLISYLAGWSALRSEELVLEYKNIPALKTWHHVGLIVLAGALSLGSIVLVKQHMLPDATWIGIIMFTLLEAAFVYWAWRMTKPMPMPSRIVSSLLLSPGIIFFMAWKKKSFLRFIGAQVVGILLYVIILFVLMIPVIISTLTLFSSYTIQTDHFAPELPMGSELFVDLSQTKPDVGEFIIFRAESDKSLVGKVISISGDQFVVDSSMGEKTITTEQIVATRMDIPESELEEMSTSTNEIQADWKPEDVY